MSTVAERTWTPTDDDLGPAKAHHAFSDDVTTALCGKRIMGIPLPAGHPVCEECRDLARDYRGSRQIYGR